uniref:Uncharacterized protein n=1 Tax=Meloidogyne enterolobii TaxID=390850 RepID=A0A6V7UIJ9_MELEN|nr:unnamed protein product [Meloidogyne enterolobii]
MLINKVDQFSTLTSWKNFKKFFLGLSTEISLAESREILLNLRTSVFQIFL